MPRAKLWSRDGALTVFLFNTLRTGHRRRHGALGDIPPRRAGFSPDGGIGVMGGFPRQDRSAREKHSAAWGKRPNPPGGWIPRFGGLHLSACKQGTNHVGEKRAFGMCRARARVFHKFESGSGYCDCGNDIQQPGSNEQPGARHARHGFPACGRLISYPRSVPGSNPALASSAVAGERHPDWNLRSPQGRPPSRPVGWPHRPLP